ncbi:hypothetical protein PQ455_13430 [Sphingomonas naphthae]|uniref:Uncharacterized protein n=1 Tax=Sphingomonas naphthae TaxID=1813468 RepID=A0ABY7TK10_9SPHN|nr:hypothetical protein [Sphingomonas naphthae]WCT72629.1 hypothetical protein PQ455_13430 [Sphingomonas naphthae]
MKSNTLHLNGNAEMNRYAVAAKRLLTGVPEPEFVGDKPSVLFSNGRDLDLRTFTALATAAAKSGYDIVHFVIDEKRPERGIQNVVLGLERDGAIHRYSQCTLWSPADGGSMLIMPQGLKICFAFDGLALISIDQRPVTAIGDGAMRARSRVRREIESVSDAELARFVPLPKAA